MLAKMILPVAGLLAFAAVSSAHFQMQYPIPRGPFVMNNEPTFCDGFTDVTTNRTDFPLGQSIITMNSEHPQWIAGVLISIEQDPTNFTVFNTSSTGVKLPLVVPFFQATGEGAACFAIDIAALNIPGVGDGSNVTIQVEFNGGDGNLFQCADLTLSNNFTVPSDVNCTNLVNNQTSTNFTATSTPSAPTSSPTSGAIQLSSGATGLLGLVAAVFLTIL